MRTSRDSYLVQSSSFAPGFSPSQDFVTRCESLIKKTLPTAKYSVDRVGQLFNCMGLTERLPQNDERKILALLKDLSPLYMKKLLKQTSYNLGRNWNGNLYPIISLYFYKLVSEDKLDEFTHLYNKIIRVERERPGDLTLEPLNLAWLYIQPRLFDAINAGDKEKILHYRKYLEPIASVVITYDSYGTNYSYTLPVALHALCYAYSDNPAEYQVFVKKQWKISSRMKRRHLLRGFFPYDPLRHATYKGKPFSDKANEDFQFKVIKQVILASRAGMFPTEFVINSKNPSHYKWLVKRKAITQRVFKKLNAFVRGNKIVIGEWTPKLIGSSSKNPKILTIDISKNITRNGNYTISFKYKKGQQRLDIDSVEILRNGTDSLGKDKHHGWTGFSDSKNTYQINITDFKPGQEYQLKAKIYGDTGNNSYGDITLIVPSEFNKISPSVIGDWTPKLIGSSSKKPKILTIDISKNITGNGNYKISFKYKKGQQRLDIDSVEILRNGTDSLGKDKHHGWTGFSDSKNTYQINIINFKPGQKYQLKAKVYGDTGNNSYGTIHLSRF